MQMTIDAKSLGLLKMLVMGPTLKLSCSGCFLHSIVAHAPLELLVTLMKAAGTALNTQHPVLKTYVIHEVLLHVKQTVPDRCLPVCCYSKNDSSPPGSSRFKCSHACLMSHSGFPAARVM